MLKLIKSDEGYLDGIINSIADPIFVKDREHRFVYLNDALCKMIGHTRAEMIGKSDYDFFPVRESDVFWEKDEFVFNEKGPNLNEETVTDAQGTIHTIITKKVLYMDMAGNKYIVGVIRDVTERRETEAKLRTRIADLELEISQLKAGSKAVK